MSHRWFPNGRSIDCDLVLASSGQVLQTLHVPVVPRVGDELEVDEPERPGRGPLYRVVRVRYHSRPGRLTMRDDLYGVSVLVEPAG